MHNSGGDLLCTSGEAIIQLQGGRVLAGGPILWILPPVIHPILDAVNHVYGTQRIGTTRAGVMPVSAAPKRGRYGRSVVTQRDGIQFETNCHCSHPLQYHSKGILFIH